MAAEDFKEGMLLVMANSPWLSTVRNCVFTFSAAHRMYLSYLVSWAGMQTIPVRTTVPQHSIKPIAVLHLSIPSYHMTLSQNKQQSELWTLAVCAVTYLIVDKLIVLQLHVSAFCQVRPQKTPKVLHGLHLQSGWEERLSASWWDHVI